jgi:hypothetical protein
MNERSSTAAYLVTIIGSFLIVAGLVWVMQQYTKPAPVNQARVAERKKFQAEIRAAEADALHSYGWQDQGKGLVRLTIERAKELTLQEYKNPAVARSNVIARAQKAFAPAANPFE